MFQFRELWNTGWTHSCQDMGTPRHGDMVRWSLVTLNSLDLRISPNGVRFRVKLLRGRDALLLPGRGLQLLLPLHWVWLLPAERQSGDWSSDWNCRHSGAKKDSSWKALNTVRHAIVGLTSRGKYLESSLQLLYFQFVAYPYEFSRKMIWMFAITIFN